MNKSLNRHGGGVETGYFLKTPSFVNISHSLFRKF